MPRQHTDPPRLLDKRPGHSYTDDPTLALPLEPEAVSAAWQRMLTADAHRNEQDQQQQTWQTHRLKLTRSIEWLHGQRFKRDVRSQVRALERQVRALDAKITGA